jgi:hypothetical protein
MQIDLMNLTLKNLYPYYPNILEFGVATGESLKYITENISTDKFKIYGFDSFEGLPEDWIGTECKKGCFSTNGIIPNINGCKFYKGWFEDTIDQYIKSESTKPISLLHIDCDLYSSTKTILNKLLPYIGTNTIILFDEWYYNCDYRCNDGEQKAFFEWIVQNNISFEFMFNELNSYYYNSDRINNKFAMNQRAIQIVYNKNFQLI